MINMTHTEGRVNPKLWNPPKNEKDLFAIPVFETKSNRHLVENLQPLGTVLTTFNSGLTVRNSTWE